MSENPEKPRGRVTPSQWLTVGVLATIFVTVLVLQFRPAGATTQPIASAAGPPGNPRRTTPASAATANPPTSGGQRTPKPDHRWRGFPLATVVQFDPFALPASLASVPDGIQPVGSVEKTASQKSEDAGKDRAKHQRDLAQLKLEVVRAVVGTDRGFVAMIGTRTIHVGDQLHGFRVKEIRADGVILEDSHD